MMTKTCLSGCNGDEGGVWSRITLLSPLCPSLAVRSGTTSLYLRVPISKVGAKNSDSLVEGSCGSLAAAWEGLHAGPRPRRASEQLAVLRLVFPPVVWFGPSRWNGARLLVPSPSSCVCFSYVADSCRVCLTSSHL